MLGAYYSDGFMIGLRVAIVVVLCVMLVLGVIVLRIMRRKPKTGVVYDWAQHGECTSREGHVRVVENTTLTEDVLNAINEAEERSLLVAKCLYDYDLREFWPGYTPFDDLPFKSKLMYFDQAEHVMMALNDSEMAG